MNFLMRVYGGRSPVNICTASLVALFRYMNTGASPACFKVVSKRSWSVSFHTLLALVMIMLSEAFSSKALDTVQSLSGGYSTITIS